MRAVTLRTVGVRIYLVVLRLFGVQELFEAARLLKSKRPLKSKSAGTQRNPAK